MDAANKALNTEKAKALQAALAQISPTAHREAETAKAHRG